MPDESLKLGDAVKDGVIHAILKGGSNVIVRMPDGTFKLVPVAELKKE